MCSAQSLSNFDFHLRPYLYEDGDSLDHAYFPEDCVISLVAMLEEGASPEMTTFGREGAVGTITLLGPTDAFGRYTVQVPGTALRMSVTRLRVLSAERPQIRDVLFRYLQALLAQTLQSVACNAAHPVEARCCRWILMTHDRVGRSELPLTHEFLAAMLGCAATNRQRCDAHTSDCWAYHAAPKVDHRSGPGWPRRGGLRMLRRNTAKVQPLPSENLLRMSHGKRSATEQHRASVR